MEKHLSRKQLIEYKFGLADLAEAREAASHLEGCGQCRKRLDRIARNFAVLELLRDDVPASGQLIEQTLAGLMQKQHIRTSPRRYAWLAAAAAVLVIGIGYIIIASLGSINPKGHDMTVNQPPEPKEKFKETQLGYSVAKVEETVALDKKGNALESDALAVRSVGRAGGVYSDMAAGVPVGKAAAAGKVAGDIFGQAPFAPASAIELVTLPRIDDLQITIYNSADITLVCQKRNLTLKAGWNWLQFTWANTLIDPTSLEIKPLAQADKIEVQQLVFPSGLRQVGRWLIRSEVTGSVPFEITYFTSGLSWRAVYMATLEPNETKLQLAGYVHIANNSGEDFEDVRTRLVVGRIHLLDEIASIAGRRYPYGPDIPILGEELRTREGVFQLHQPPVPQERLDRNFSAGYYFYGNLIVKQAISEYFLYTIEGTQAIPDKQAKRLLSFDTDDIPVKSRYKYEQERYGTQTVRFITFVNDKKHQLGKTPLPEGNIRVFRTIDGDNHLSFTGSADIKYIPVNETAELNLGSDNLVFAEPKLMDTKTQNYQFDRDGNITGWDSTEDWKVELTNTREIPVEIEITRDFGTTDWKIALDKTTTIADNTPAAAADDTSASGDDRIRYRKYNVKSARFTAALKPASKRSFGYTVTRFFGSRQEQQKAADSKEQPAQEISAKGKPQTLKERIGK